MNYYYLTPDKKPCGPLPLEGMCAMVERGQLSASVLVAKEGDSAWRTLLAVAVENGIDLKLEGLPGACPTCGKPLQLLPEGTLPHLCTHCGRVFRPEAGKEENLWYNFTMALRQYAKFSGRATRKEYWSYWLFSTIITMVPCMLLMVTGLVLTIAQGAQAEESMLGVGLVLLGYVVNYGLSAFFIIPSYAVWVRRLHDVGWSGKWVLAFVLCFLLFLICLIVGAVVGGSEEIEMMNNDAWLFWSLAGVLYVVGIVIAIMSFVLIFIDSQRGPNKYGPSRKYPMG